MLDMGREETPETCEWDIAGSELKALEDMLRTMMTFESAERPTAKLLRSGYMMKWAIPARERQMKRKSPRAAGKEHYTVYIIVTPGYNI
jgi:hypothetical protein